MIPLPYFFALCLMMFVWLCLGLFWGYRYALHHHKIPDVEGINKYLKKNFPSEWAAYKKGAHEGYEQGLKDGREPPL
jgi:hypothetical protein